MRLGGVSDRNRPQQESGEPRKDGWDWSSTVIVALGIFILLLITNGLWRSH